MMQAGRQVLLRLDNVLADNSDALHGTLDNLNTFSDALSRNSERVDGIFAGLERLTGGGKKGPDPGLRPDGAEGAPRPAAKTPGGLAGGSRADGAAGLRLGEDPGAPGHRTASPPSRACSGPITCRRSSRKRSLQSFENAGFGQSVSRPVDGVTPDYQLLIDIRVVPDQHGRHAVRAGRTRGQDRGEQRQDRRLARLPPKRSGEVHRSAGCRCRARSGIWQSADGPGAVDGGSVEPAGGRQGLSPSHPWGGPTCRPQSAGPHFCI